MPYICFIENCQRPDDLYRTVEELTTHVINDHGIPCWICDICTPDIDQDTFDIFHTAQDWRNHLHSVHLQVIPDTLFPQLAKASTRRMIPPLNCPLCDFCTGEIKPNIDPEITRHIHRFSLRALPWETEQEENLSNNHLQGVTFTSGTIGSNKRRKNAMSIEKMPSPIHEQMKSTSSQDIQLQNLQLFQRTFSHPILKDQPIDHDRLQDLPGKWGEVLLPILIQIQCNFEELRIFETRSKDNQSEEFASLLTAELTSSVHESSRRVLSLLEAPDDKKGQGLLQKTADSGDAYILQWLSLCNQNYTPGDPEYVRLEKDQPFILEYETADMHHGMMDGYRVVGNSFYGDSAQVNGQVIFNAIQPLELQPSFFKTSAYEQHKNINPKRVPETCLWFLEHPKFNRWKASSHDDFLWLSADPGCGKSVLSRALIDEKLISEGSNNIFYFFFSDNEEQDNAAVALCALLHQIFWWNDDLLKRHATQAVKKCGEALRTDLEELWRIFESVVSDPTIGNIVCVLDALDECQENSRNRLILCLEDFFTRSINVATQANRVKFIVTCRPYREIERQFARLARNIFPSCRLAAENESEEISREIKIFIKAKTEEIARKWRLHEGLQSSLEKRLGDSPNRTYLWLQLILNEIESQIPKGKTEKKLLAIIDTLPGSIENAYERILARGDAEEAKKTLQIIVAARRTLTLEELDLALEIEPESTSYNDLDTQGSSNRRNSIRESCGLFINVINSRVYLIHETAREFLIRKSNTMPQLHRWKGTIDLREGNRVLAEICVTYLLFREVEHYSTLNPDRRSSHASVDESEDKSEDDLMHEPENKDPDHPLFDYAAKYWISHVQDADDVDPALIARMTELCEIGDGSSCA